MLKQLDCAQHRSPLTFLVYGQHESILSEAEVHWCGFLDSLVARGLRGVHFIISDDEAGLLSRHPGCAQGRLSQADLAQGDLAQDDLARCDLAALPVSPRPQRHPPCAYRGNPKGHRPQATRRLERHGASQRRGPHAIVIAWGGSRGRARIVSPDVV